MDLVEPVEHVVFQRIVGKWHDSEHQLAVTDFLAIAGDTGFGFGKPGAVVFQCGFYSQNLARFDKSAQLGRRDIG